MVKSCVAVHAFDVAAVKKPISEGMVIVRETYRAGQTALKGRDSSRIGLAISLITILDTMLGLWLAAAWRRLNRLCRVPSLGGRSR